MISMVEAILCIPMAIGLISLYGGVMMIIGIIATNVTGSSDIFACMIHFLNVHWGLCLIGGFLFNYIALFLLFFYGIL